MPDNVGDTETAVGETAAPLDGAARTDGAAALEVATPDGTTAQDTSRAQDTSAAQDAGASRAESAPPTGRGRPARSPARPTGTLVLLVLALIWLGGYLWSANESIDNADSDPLVAVITAALALPGMIGATMLAGAAAAVALLAALAARWSPRTWRAAGSAAAAGLVVGALAGGLVLIGYGERSSILVLAGTVLVAGTIGGLLGSLRPRAMTAAGLVATLVAFFIGFALDYKQERLLKLFGAGSSVKSQVDALTLLTLAQSVVAGLIAGVVAYHYLRRTGPGQRFPAYFAAGAMPGVFLLLAELVTWIGGRQLLGAAGSASSLDRAFLDYAGSTRLNHGLAVLFVGGITAMVAFGRTLGPRRPR